MNVSPGKLFKSRTLLESGELKGSIVADSPNSLVFFFPFPVTSYNKLYFGKTFPNLKPLHKVEVVSIKP